MSTPTASVTRESAEPAIAPRTTGIHHVSLRVTDLARARIFYHERLGFPLVKEAPGAFLFVAGAVVVGVRAPAPETSADDVFDPFRVGLDHLALGCPDEEELRRVGAALTAAGIEHTGIKRDAVFGNLYLAFRDPDGIKWEFYLPA